MGGNAKRHADLDANYATAGEKNSCAGRQESRATLRRGMQCGTRRMIDQFES